MCMPLFIDAGIYIKMHVHLFIDAGMYEMRARETPGGCMTFPARSGKAIQPLGFIGAEVHVHLFMCAGIYL